MAEWDEELFEDPEETPNEGMKNLREAKKASDKRAKEAEAELNELRAAAEAANVAAREQNITALLEAGKLPQGLAKVYPADREVSAEAISEWAVEEIGMRPQVEEGAPDANSVWERYDQFVRSSFAGGGEDRLSTITDRAMQGVMKALGPATSETIRASKFKPTPEEEKDAREVTDAVNALHGELEGQVSRGKAEPFLGGFGGKLNPPYHANRALQAINSMRGNS